MLRGLREPEAAYLVPVPETGSVTRFIDYASEGSVLFRGTPPFFFVICVFLFVLIYEQ